MRFTKPSVLSFSILLLIAGVNADAWSQEKTISVAFKNQSKHLLNCGILKNVDYLTFVILAGQRQQRFDEFVAGSRIRCAFALDSKSATKWSYFEVKLPGVYQLSLVMPAPCPTCSGTGPEPSVTVVDPHGQAVEPVHAP
jgi:hypothetical protein